MTTGINNRNKSYRQALNTFIGIQGFKIWKYLKENKPLTSREISKATGVERTSVVGRLNGLIKKGLVIEYGSKVCPVTGKIVTIYKAQDNIFSQAYEEVLSN